MYTKFVENFEVNVMQFRMHTRNVLLVALDIVVINISMVLAFLLRFDLNIQSVEGYGYFYIYLSNIIEITAIKLILLYLFGVYNSLWRYTSIDELVKIVLSLIFGTLACYGYLFIFDNQLPRSIYILTLIMDILMISGIRISYRILRRYRRHIHKKKHKRTLIYGAGQAGAMLIKELKEHLESDMDPVLLVDDDPLKVGKYINGVLVVSGDQLEMLFEKHSIDVFIIAMPSASKAVINEIFEKAKDFKGERKILPSVYELMNEKISISSIRNIRIEDLLGRDVVTLDNSKISHFINDRVVAVTGGAGSIGSELVRQISKYAPKIIHIIDLNENEMHFLSLELAVSNPDVTYEFHVLNIRERNSVFRLFEKLTPEIVFHAAAHKHVPLMESNPFEAVKNNVFGTQNLIDASKKTNVKKFVQISTDKAVNPTNVMGATKRICEMMIQSCHFERETKLFGETEFAAVRFGNVLGSNGSVIPIFKKQIEMKGPVTLTHPDITRYFMTIPEAASLVLQAGAMAKGGEIFVLDMGEPVKIIDLAKNLIRLSGFEPYKDIDIQISGLRPGEKMYEELLMDSNAMGKTTHEKIFVEPPMCIEDEYILEMLEQLEKALSGKDSDIKSTIKKYVPSYQFVN